MNGLPGGSDDGDRVEDVVALGRVEVVQVLFDAVDERPDAGDFGGAGFGLGAGLVIELGGGADPFAVGEELVEVAAQFWQVGGVGAEVSAAGAAEPERAGATARLKNSTMSLRDRASGLSP